MRVMEIRRLGGYGKGLRATGDDRRPSGRKAWPEQKRSASDEPGFETCPLAQS